MQLTINGKKQTITNAQNVAEIIRSLGYEGDFFAVALNRTVIPRTRYAATPVNENDEIEILSPMQGG